MKGNKSGCAGCAWCILVCGDLVDFCSTLIVWRCESVIGRHHYTRYINQVVVKSSMQKIMGEMFQLLKVSRFSWRCAQNKLLLPGHVQKIVRLLKEVFKINNKYLERGTKENDKISEKCKVTIKIFSNLAKGKTKL